MVASISLTDLGIWFGIFSIVMLAASELGVSYYGRARILVELKNLRRVGMVFAAMFFLVVSVTIASLLNS